MGVSLKGEVGELLRQLMGIKAKVDGITPSMLMSQNKFPDISTTLNDVNKKTEQAAQRLLASAQKLEDFYKNLLIDVNSIAKSIADKDKSSYDKLHNIVIEKIDNASDLGLYVLETLEFQDITEQKLRKAIRSLDDVGARIGAIVGYIRANDMENRKNYDSLLSDLGFA